MYVHYVPYKATILKVTEVNVACERIEDDRLQASAANVERVLRDLQPEYSSL